MLGDRNILDRRAGATCVKRPRPRRAAQVVGTTKVSSHTAETLSVCPTWATAPGFVLALLLSAATTSVGLASPTFDWFVWGSLVPLFVVVRFVAPRGALIYGGLWGIAFCLFSALRPEDPICPTVRSAALLTIAPAGYVCLGSFLTRRIGFAPLFLGLGWIVVELALKTLGLGHGLVVGTQEDGGILCLLGESLGSGLVAFLVVFFNASLFLVLTYVPLRLRCAGLRICLQKAAQTMPWRGLWFVFSVLLTPAQPRAPPTCPNAGYQPVPNSSLR